MRLAPLLLMLCLITGPVMATEALSGDALALADGRTVRLVGILAPQDGADAAAAKHALQTLLAGCNPTLDHTALDRYGRTNGDAFCTHGAGQPIWLQGEMLRQGLVFRLSAEQGRTATAGTHEG